MLLRAQQEGATQTYYAQGFPVGLIDTNTNKYYVNNHVHMVVDYHPMEVTEVRKSRKLYRERLLFLAEDMLTVGVFYGPLGRFFLPRERLLLRQSLTEIIYLVELNFFHVIPQYPLKPYSVETKKV